MRLKNLADKFNFIILGLTQICKFCSNTGTAIWGLMLKFVYLMPDYWLEVSLHSEVPATGQLDQGFL
jgi:hypothetical protein